MKKIWFLFLGLISCFVWGQIPVKIYAYSQVEMPGIVPARIMDENGNLINTKKQPPVTITFLELSLSLQKSALLKSGSMEIITKPKPLLSILHL